MNEPMTTTTTPDRDHPEPTEIDGISRSGVDEYEVSFTLWVDADSPEQAAERSMQMRHMFVTGFNDGQTIDVDYDWHLHDHDGC